MKPSATRAHRNTRAQGETCPSCRACRAIRDLRPRRCRRVAVHCLTAPRGDVAEHRAIRDAVPERKAPLAGEMIRAQYMRRVETVAVWQFS